MFSFNFKFSYTPKGAKIGIFYLIFANPNGLLMKNSFKYICIVVLASLFQAWVAIDGLAQDLPLMPPDPAVSTGVLPNGMTYYVVTNPSVRGTADFALVQKTGSQTAHSEYDGQALAVARDALSDLPRLQSSSLQTFLADHGVAPGKDGFVKVSENATLYHFSNVVVSEGEGVVDSTLLVLMDIADRGTRSENEFLSRWYAPADQAVVVSGDVYASSIAVKLKHMSYMTPARESQQRDEYRWQECDDPVFEVSPYLPGNIATVSATWTFPRTPKEYMNTIQPAIYEMFVAELGMIAQERLIREFERRHIPATGVSYRHITSVRSLGDEQFTIQLAVSPDNAAEAVAVLAAVMSSLDSGTAAEHELEMVKNRYIFHLEKQARNPFKDNSDYVDRCASAFLYNSPLSSEKEVAAFLRSRNLDIGTELAHFNNIASALLDSRRNLTLECQVGGGLEFGSASLESVFSEAWESSSCEPCPSPADSIPLPSGSPVKLKSTKKEPLSGGVLWTFSNGFKVVYKRQESGRRMHYMLAMNGGYGNISDLSEGEGAYMTDYLNLCRVSGMTHEEFARTLENEDITLDAVVNLSNMLISGSAPDSSLDLMMRSLLAFVCEREHDPEAYRYYLACLDVEKEYGRGSVSDRVSAIDSLMCPGYRYSHLKTAGKLTEDFPSRADGFLKRQSSKMNDGVLVLVGNIEETRLRKFIQNYIGGFMTTERRFPRTVVHYQTVSGATTYVREGRSNSVDVTLSVPMSLTADNYMASHIAADILRQTVSAALDGTGMYLKMSYNCRIYPEERFNVMITLEEASEYGFSSAEKLTGADVALKNLRDVLAGLPELEVKEDDVAKYKSVLKGRMAIEMQEPQYWTRAVAMRYMDGKNFTTGYEGKIDAVTADRVSALLASLADASRVEYIIRK